MQHNYITLYRKIYFLEDDLPFSDYIKLVDELNLSPNLIKIKETSQPDRYILQTHFSPPPLPFNPFMKPFSDLIILNKCTICFTSEERKVTLTAGLGGFLFFIIAFYFSFFIFTAYHAVVGRSSFAAIIAIFIALLITAIYLRDLRRYEIIKNARLRIV